MGLGLGFNMKIIWSLFAGVAAFVVLSSCTQNKKLEEDLGAQVSNDAYQKAVIQSWGDTDLAQMKQGDYAYIEKLIGINNAPLKKVIGKGMTITEVEEATDLTNFHLVIQSEEMVDNSQGKLSSRERVLSVKKTSSASSQQQVRQKDTEDEIQTTPFENFVYALSICSYKTIQCYRFKIEDFTEDVPAEMQGSNKNCRGFENCKWSGKKISLVIKVSSQDPTTKETKTFNNIISYKVVPKMPYLFRMVEYCFQGMSEYQNQKFPVRVCQNVKDTMNGQ